MFEFQFKSQFLLFSASQVFIVWCRQPGNLSFGQQDERDFAFGLLSQAELE